jgi:hypothetical protein
MIDLKNIEELTYEAEWTPFGKNGARLKIRPYPASKGDVVIKDGAMHLTGKAGLEMFCYCLTEWEGFGSKGKVLPLTEDTKKKLYDFRISAAIDDSGEETVIADFVALRAQEMAANLRAAEKN